MKKGVVVLFTAMLLALCAVAGAQTVTSSTFFVTVEPVKDNIMDPAKDHADMYIVVENKGETADTFRLLYLEDPKWSYQVIPSPIDKEITVEPGEKGKIHLLVKGNVPEGNYGVKVSVRSENTKNTIENVMRIKVGERAPTDPPAADFDVDVSVPAQMDPTGTYNVIVNIKNNNERTLDNVQVKLNSKILSEKTNVTVQPNESKSVSFAVILMDNIKPQKDQLRVTVNYDGEEFHSADHNFEVVEYLPPFRTDINVEKKWLKQVRTITISNDGNTVKADAVRLETSLKEKFFSRSVPKFKSLESDGKYYFAWDVSLEPEKSTEIKLTTSYRLLVLIALIIIALLIYKVATSNPLIVKKKVKSMKKEHGAISSMTVVIYLKNRSKETLSNLRVVERVTRMVQLKKDSFAGSMHPVKMHTHDREGTLLEYRFGELTPGDERIITYKVHSKLHIFGTVSIKPTVVEFTSGKGVKKKSRSRELNVATEEPAAPKPVEKKEHHEHKGHKEHHAHDHKEHHK